MKRAGQRFESIITNAGRTPLLHDDSKAVVVHINKQVMILPEFLDLWSKIKQKTAYRVSIDTDTLIENSVKALKAMPAISKTRLISQTADIYIEMRVDLILSMRCRRKILIPPIRHCPICLQ